MQSIRVHLMADVFLSRQQGPDGVDDGSGALNGLPAAFAMVRLPAAVSCPLSCT